MRKRIDHYCSVVPENYHLSGPPFSGTSGWDFPVPLDTSDGFYLSHIPVPTRGKDKKMEQTHVERQVDIVMLK